MVERSVSAAGAKTPAELGIKLVALRESDDIEAYLVTFERIMAAHKIERRPEQRSSGRGPRCYSCHQFGHISSKCPSRGSYYGGRTGNCRKLENEDTLVPVRSGRGYGCLG